MKFTEPGWEDIDTITNPTQIMAWKHKAVITFKNGKPQAYYTGRDNDALAWLIKALHDEDPLIQIVVNTVWDSEVYK